MFNSGFAKFQFHIQKLEIRTSVRQYTQHI